MYYEKAYCQYRLNLTEEAKETLEQMRETSQRKKELLCQILYRLERYEECYDIYRDVIKNSSDAYEDERQSNLTAIAASLSISGSVSKKQEKGKINFIGVPDTM